jgi:hypothetical protein
MTSNTATIQMWRSSTKRGMTMRAIRITGRVTAENNVDEIVLPGLARN